MILYVPGPGDLDSWSGPEARRPGACPDCPAPVSRPRRGARRRGAPLLWCCAQCAWESDRRRGWFGGQCRRGGAAGAPSLPERLPRVGAGRQGGGLRYGPSWLRRQLPTHPRGCDGPPGVRDPRGRLGGGLVYPGAEVCSALVASRVRIFSWSWAAWCTPGVEPRLPPRRACFAGSPGRPAFLLLRAEPAAFLACRRLARCCLLEAGVAAWWLML